MCSSVFPVYCNVLKIVCRNKKENHINKSTKKETSLENYLKTFSYKIFALKKIPVF